MFCRKLACVQRYDTREGRRETISFALNNPNMKTNFQGISPAFYHAIYGTHLCIEIYITFLKFQGMILCKNVLRTSSQRPFPNRTLKFKALLSELNSSTQGDTKERQMNSYSTLSKSKTWYYQEVIPHLSQFAHLPEPGWSSLMGLLRCSDQIKRALILHS